MRHVLRAFAVLTMIGLSAGSAWSQDPGPIGPSPYEAGSGRRTAAIGFARCTR
jgi:hypothetical protein